MRDRSVIAAGRAQGMSLRAIGRMIDRDASVISRELSRHRLAGGGYAAVRADVGAQRRRGRPQARRLDTCAVLKARVLGDLGRGRSPRAIAGRLKAEAGGDIDAVSGSVAVGGERVSHEAIYTWMYALAKGELARRGIRLDSGRTRRVARKSLGQRRSGPIVGMTSIEDRPGEVAGRKVPGHWEGDLIIGAHGASAAATLVERTSRFTVILGLPEGKNSDALADHLITEIGSWPAPFNRSLTWDQGSEMARHATVTMATGMPVYFAHPHSPWERPTNENTNRIVRRYLPKGSVITSHQPYLDAIAEEINEIPRAVLGYLTPREVFQRLLTQDVASTS